MLRYKYKIFRLNLRRLLNGEKIERDRRGVCYQDYIIVSVNSINLQNPCNLTEDVTPPVLTFVNAPPRSGSDVKITWAANENVTSQCTLQTPSQITASPCNISWTGTNLTEGYHSIYVQVTDLAGNTAPPVRHSWFVGMSL